jgi:hypothetical protein
VSDSSAGLLAPAELSATATAVGEQEQGEGEALSSKLCFDHHLYSGDLIRLYIAVTVLCLIALSIISSSNQKRKRCSSFDRIWSRSSNGFYMRVSARSKI